MQSHNLVKCPAFYSHTHTHTHTIANIDDSLFHT